MAKLTTEELIEQFKDLTLLELSEFVKAFEETFDVTAAAPAAAAVAAAPGAAGEAAAEEEKDEFDVVLEAAGDKKIQVIKEVRTLTSLGLKEAKELVDGAPKAVLEGANKEAAEKAKAQLEGAGATVTLKCPPPRPLGHSASGRAIRFRLLRGPTETEALDTDRAPFASRERGPVRGAGAAGSRTAGRRARGGAGAVRLRGGIRVGGTGQYA